MEIKPYKPTNIDNISSAQRRLNFKFPSDYINFIQSGYDLGDSIIETLMIDPISPHLDIYNESVIAWDKFNIPRDWLPIAIDNGNYFLMNSNGQVKYWSHDKMFNDEEWESVILWIHQLKNESGK